MARFVEIGSDVVNVDQIAKICESDKPGFMVLITKDGERSERYGNFDELSIGLTCQIVPAFPGYYFVSKDGNQLARKEPIIAWRINNVGYSFGVSCDGPKTHGQFILDPLGQVIDPDNRIWDTLEEWLKGDTNA